MSTSTTGTSDKASGFSEKDEADQRQAHYDHGLEDVSEEERGEIKKLVKRTTRG